MAEEPDAIEETELETEVETYDDDPDDDLYSVLPGRSGKTPSLGVGRAADEDETPFHKIDFMHDVPLRLCVEIGQTQLTVREILGMKVGNVIEFTKVVGEPMDITVSGRLMARGEIVVVNERYGVRISEVTRPDETETTFSQNS